MSSSEESKPAAAAAGGGPSGGESGPSHASAPGQDAYKKHVTVEGGLQKKTRRSAKQHKGRHHIEVPEHAERELGVVISHQEKVGSSLECAQIAIQTIRGPENSLLAQPSHTARQTSAA